MSDQTKTTRTIEQWRNMQPAAVCAGSPAQVQHCIADAQHDILALAREVERLRAALSDALVVFSIGEPHKTKWRETYADIIDRAVRAQEVTDDD